VGVFTVIDSMVDEFRRKFGEDAIFHLNDRPVSKGSFISTGSFSVDYVVGRPGLPLGRLTEIYGPFSSGKSSVVASLIGSCQARGGKAVLFDGEHSFTPQWVDTFKVQNDKLLVAQPATIRDMFEQAAYLADNISKSSFEGPVVLAIDSLSSFPTPEELEFLNAKDDDKRGDRPGSLGLHARYFSKGLRVLSNLVWNSQICLVVVSQLKENPMNPYQGFKIGGQATNFHAAVQLKTSKVGKHEDRIRVKVTAVKNKVAPPFRSATYDIVFGQGIDDSLCFAKVGMDLGLVKKKGAGWYDIGDGKGIRAETIIEKIGLEIYKQTFAESSPTSATPPITDHVAEDVQIESEIEVPAVVGSE